MYTPKMLNISIKKGIGALLNLCVNKFTPYLSPPSGNAVKLSEICGDSFCDKVSQVAQDSQVSQVPRMR